MPQRPAAESGTDAPETATSGDAFQALAGETRMAILRALDADQPRAFSDLFGATDADTSAGFAYHLRQLTGRFIRQREDERYELTDAGRRVARGVRAGLFTESVDRDPVALAEPCPLCGETALTVAVADNVATVGCRACESSLLATSLPPGFADRPDGAVPGILDSRYRRRIDLFRDGVCPDCAGPVEGRLEPAGEGEGDRPVWAVYRCETCGETLRCPVTLSVIGHPAVVAFYHDHGEDVRERPVWNVGEEWSQRLLSRDPRCALVRTRRDGDSLSLYVDRDGTVVDSLRRPIAGEAGRPDGRGDDPDDPDDPDGGRPVPPSADAAGRADVEEALAEDAEVTEPTASAGGATA